MVVPMSTCPFTCLTSPTGAVREGGAGLQTIVCVSRLVMLEAQGKSVCALTLHRYSERAVDNLDPDFRDRRPRIRPMNTNSQAASARYMNSRGIRTTYSKSVAFDN